MNKKSMPHIKVKEEGKDKGTADLFFEFLESPERKEFYEDLTEGSNIKLPDFGKVDGIEIKNPEVKNLNEKQITNKDEEFIKRFLRDQKVNRPYLDYDKSQHSYKLKPKYDLEQIMKEVTEKQPA
jgi:nucleoside-diphosphate-sugar epimerase